MEFNYISLLLRRFNLTPHAAKIITQEDQDLFARVREAVLALPDDLRDEDGQLIEVSCHNLARAVGQAFKLKWQDGYVFIKFHPHSWVLTPKGNIIDVYPIGVLGGPIMMDANNCFLGKIMYVDQDTSRISRKKFGDKKFRKQVAILHRELKKASRLFI